MINYTAITYELRDRLLTLANTHTHTHTHTHTAVYNHWTGIVDWTGRLTL